MKRSFAQVQDFYKAMPDVELDEHRIALEYECRDRGWSQPRIGALWNDERLAELASLRNLPLREQAAKMGITYSQVRYGTNVLLRSRPDIPRSKYWRPRKSKIKEGSASIDLSICRITLR